VTWTVDRTILAATSASVIGEIGINFATSYQHIYDLGLKFGETGTAARLQPAGVDLALLAFALGNLFLARHGRKHWFVWTALLFGLAGLSLPTALTGQAGPRPACCCRHGHQCCCSLPSKSA